MNHTQKGLLLPIPQHSRYLSFQLVTGGDPMGALQRLSSLCDGESLVLGLSQSCVQALQCVVPGLRSFVPLSGPGFDVPSTQEALWCWLRGHERGELVLRAMEIEELLLPDFELGQVVDGFKHGNGLDLTGYEDGTENPKGQEAVDAALVQGQGEGLDFSSFVAVQQWEHDFTAFSGMSKQEQDHVIGRERVSKEELEDAPESAHVKRTAQESFAPEAFVLRRSCPLADERGAGFYFVAFGRSFDAFEAQMRRMVGLDDGIVDGLFSISKPLTGSYYWCPPMLNGTLYLRAIKR